MERLSEGAIRLNDNEVFNNCSYSCYSNLVDALSKLKEYENNEDGYYRYWKATNKRVAKLTTVNYLKRIKILYERNLGLEEQLIKIIETAESQIHLIKVIADFTDVHLYPQIQSIEEARKVLGGGY